MIPHRGYLLALKVTVRLFFFSFPFPHSAKSNPYRPTWNYESARGGSASRHRASDQGNDHAVHHARELSDFGRHPSQHRSRQLRRAEAR